MEINWEPSRKQLRQFAVLLAVFGAVVASMVAARSDFSEPMTGLAIFATGLAIGIMGMVWPATMLPIYKGWMLATWPIGWLTSHLLLAAIFYLVVTPIGLLMRACGHDPLRRKGDGRSESYWLPRHRGNNPQRYFRQY